MHPTEKKRDWWAFWIWGLDYTPRTTFISWRVGSSY